MSWLMVQLKATLLCQWMVLSGGNDPMLFKLKRPSWWPLLVLHSRLTLSLPERQRHQLAGGLDNDFGFLLKADTPVTRILGSLQFSTKLKVASWVWSWILNVVVQGINSCFVIIWTQVSFYFLKSFKGIIVEFLCSKVANYSLNIRM